MLFGEAIRPVDAVQVSASDGHVEVSATIGQRLAVTFQDGHVAEKIRHARKHPDALVLPTANVSKQSWRRVGGLALAEPVFDEDVLLTIVEWGEIEETGHGQGKSGAAAWLGAETRCIEAGG